MPRASQISAKRLPTIYIPHGGGPCFFMEWTLGPRDTWDRMAAFLRTIPQRYPTARALLVVSAHWEEPVVTVQTGERPPLVFDYDGFPAHTYELRWAAPGAPALAARVRELLGEAGIESREDVHRGFDHGVFIPLKVAFPEPTLPTVQISLDASLDARRHLALGRALAPSSRRGCAHRRQRHELPQYAGADAARFSPRRVAGVRRVASRDLRGGARVTRRTARGVVGGPGRASGAPTRRASPAPDGRRRRGARRGAADASSATRCLARAISAFEFGTFA